MITRFIIIIAFCVVSVYSIKPPRVCPVIHQPDVIGSGEFIPPLYYCTKRTKDKLLIRVPQFGSPVGRCKPSWVKCETCESKAENIKQISYAIANDLIDYIDKKWMLAQERVYKNSC